MNATSSHRLAEMNALKAPTVTELTNEMASSINAAASMGVFEKLARCHELRRCIWPGQQDDGKKRGKDAFPYENAIDTKARVAEPIIRDEVRICMSSVRSGVVGFSAENEIEDQGKAQRWDKLLKWYARRKRRQHRNGAKLFFTSVREFGYGIGKVCWESKTELLPMKVDIAQLTNHLASGMLEAAGLTEETAPTMDPAEVARIQDETTLAAATRMMEWRMGQVLPDGLVALLLSYDPTMPDKEARRVARKLQKQDVVEYHTPRELPGGWWMKPLIPWVDCLHGIEMSDREEPWWVSEMEWWTEERLREEAAANEWSDELVEDLLKHANTNWCMGNSVLAQLPSWLINGVGIGYEPSTTGADDARRVQIFKTTRRAMSDFGVMAVFETTFCPQYTDAVLSHKVIKATRMPFVVQQCEPASLAVQSRGVPDMVDTDQVATKKLKDAITAMAEIEAYPPSVQYSGETVKVKPGAVFHQSRASGLPSAAQASHFIGVPGVSAGALKALETFKAHVDEMFHRGPNADPEMKRLYLEDLGTDAVEAWEELMSVAWGLIQQHVDVTTAARVVGMPVTVEMTAEDLYGQADVRMEFSTLSLNREQAKELADFVANMAKLDRGGRYNWDRAIEIITRMYDVTVAEQIVTPGDVDSAAVENQQKQDLAVLASGQQPPVRQGAEQLRLQVINDWLTNPQVQASIQVNEVMQQRLQVLIDAYSFALQQQNNATIGVLGYDPSKDPVLGTGAEVQSETGMMEEAA